MISVEQLIGLIYNTHIPPPPGMYAPPPPLPAMVAGSGMGGPGPGGYAPHPMDEYDYASSKRKEPFDRQRGPPKKHRY